MAILTLEWRPLLLYLGMVISFPFWLSFRGTHMECWGRKRTLDEPDQPKQAWRSVGWQMEQLRHPIILWHLQFRTIKRILSSYSSDFPWSKDSQSKPLNSRLRTESRIYVCVSNKLQFFLINSVFRYRICRVEKLLWTHWTQFKFQEAWHFEYLHLKASNIFVCC